MVVAVCKLVARPLPYWLPPAPPSKPCPPCGRVTPKPLPSLRSETPNPPHCRGDPLRGSHHRTLRVQHLNPCPPQSPRQINKLEASDSGRHRRFRGRHFPVETAANPRPALGSVADKPPPPKRYGGAYVFRAIPLPFRCVPTPSGSYRAVPALSGETRSPEHAATDLNTPFYHARHTQRSGIVSPSPANVREFPSLLIPVSHGIVERMGGSKRR